jgi:hypothetical protein
MLRQMTDDGHATKRQRTFEDPGPDPVPDPNVAFRDCAARGDLEGMRRLYGTPGLDIFASGAWDMAQHHGHTHILQELLIRAIDIAVKRGAVDVVKTLVAEPHAMVTHTVLREAIQLNRADIVRTLLTCHVVDRQMALLKYALEGGNIDIISMLLHHVRPTVHYIRDASKHASIEVVELMLGHAHENGFGSGRHAALLSFWGAVEGSQVEQMSDSLGSHFFGTFSSPMLDVLEEFIRTPRGRQKMLEDAVTDNKLDMVRRLIAADSSGDMDVDSAWNRAERTGNVEVARELLSKYDISPSKQMQYPKSIRDMVNLRLALFDEDSTEKVRELVTTITDPLDILPSVKYIASVEEAGEEEAILFDMMLERLVGEHPLQPDSITPRSEPMQKVWDKHVRWSVLRSAWIGSMIRVLDTKQPFSAMPKK